MVWKGTLHVGMETLLKICGVAAPAALLHWNSGYVYGSIELYYFVDFFLLLLIVN